MMLAGEDLGRRHQRRLAAALDRGQHRDQRDDGLAAADIALQQPHHAPRLRSFPPAISAIARRCAPVSAKPSAASTGRLQGAGADDRPPLLPVAPGADQRHRELARKDLVIGEPLARRGGRQRDRPRSRGACAARDRLAPSRPAAPLAQRRVDPFRQCREAVERRPDRPLHDARRQAGGQRIDRLDRLAAGRARPAATRGPGAPSAACRRNIRRGR